MERPGSRSGPVLLYDGVCGFCHRFVRSVLRHDPGGIVRFAPLQGQFAEDVLSRHPELRSIDSLLFVENDGAERISVRSDAFIRVAARLGGAWRLVGSIVRSVPRPLRDAAYDRFARSRYRWFGRYDSCPIPPPEVRDRFLA